MDQRLLGVIEMVFSFGVVLAIGFQQLWSISRSRKRDQLEAEKSKREGETDSK
jgi:hypothetical protein